MDIVYLYIDLLCTDMQKKKSSYGYEKKTFLKKNFLRVLLSFLCFFFLFVFRNFSDIY